MAVWYLGNIYYNIYNKKACIALGKNAAGASNAHWALSAVQVRKKKRNVLHDDLASRWSILLSETKFALSIS